MTTFLNAATIYGDRGITVIPNVKDAAGVPKQRVTDDFLRLRPEDNAAWDWSRAAGLAIVLGRPSGCLACVDVAGFGEWLMKQLLTWRLPPLMCTTPKGLHVLTVEPVPSRKVTHFATYQNRRCPVELLAAGDVATVPPTPGYRWADPHAQPYYCTIGDLWHRLSLEFGFFTRVAPRSWRGGSKTANRLQEAVDVGT